jgi:Protein of unknown function (DUF3096)
MTVTFSAGPVIALIAGILILIMPRLLNYIVAIYLIVIGLLGLFGGHGHLIEIAVGSRGRPAHREAPRPR